MKNKLLYILAFAALATACSHNDDPDPEPVKPEPVDVDLTVEVRIGEDTKTSYSPATSSLGTAWKDGDVITAWQNGVVSRLTLTSSQGGMASFSGRMDNSFKDRSIVYFCYPGITSEGVFDISVQDGTLKGLAASDCMTGSGLYDKYTADIDGGEAVTLKRNAAIAHLSSIDFGEGTEGNVKRLTVNGSGIGNSISFHGGNRNNIEKGDISITVESALTDGRLSDVWVAFFPKTSVQTATADLTAEMEDGRKFNGTLAFGSAPQSGKVYNLEVAVADTSMAHGVDFYMGGIADTEDDPNFLHRTVLWKNGEMTQIKTNVANWQAIKDIETEGSDIYFLQSYIPTYQSGLTYLHGVTSADVHFVYKNDFDIPYMQVTSSHPLLDVNTLCVDDGKVYLGGETADLASDGSSNIASYATRATVWEDGVERRLESVASDVLASIVIDHKVYYAGFNSRLGMTAYGYRLWNSVAVIWDTEGHTFVLGPVNTSYALESKIYGLALSEDGKTLYAAGQENTGNGRTSGNRACVWKIPVSALNPTMGNDLRSHAEKTTLETTGAGISIASCVTVDGDDVYVGGLWQPESLNSNRPAIWKNGEMIGSIPHGGYVRDIASHDGEVVAVGKGVQHGWSGAVRYDIVDGEVVTTPLLMSTTNPSEILTVKYHVY